VYWYNPTTKTMEHRDAPATYEEALRVLGGDPDSEAFVREYRGWRILGNDPMAALYRTGEAFRQMHAGRQPSVF
jgi:hypothetical protein